MGDIAIRNLVAAIILQAAKDFVYGTPAKKTAILKDLRSPRMEFMSNGQSVVIAEQLELYPDEIAERIKRSCKDVV